MASSRNISTAAGKHLRVLLPFSCNTLRIPDELAEEIGAGIGGAGEVLVVGKVKNRRVKVGRDLEGAFLGRGWPEFAEASGAGAGWFLVFRHRGRGVLTVKAFDASRCLWELTPPAVDAATSSKDARRRPQFICRLPRGSMEKMLIPSKFVQHYIPREDLNDRAAMVIGPFGDVCPVELEMNRSDVFFAGGWSKFLAFHDITEADALVLRYEGSLVFTVKVFGPNGYQRDSRNKEIRLQQMYIKLPDIEKNKEAPSVAVKKRKSKNHESSGEVQKRSKGSTSLKKASSQAKCAYEIGPPAWMKKKINTNTIRSHLPLPAAFCKAIGLPEMEPCMIILKTTLSSTEYWPARVLPYVNTSYQLGLGWKSFCRENKIKEGDVCTFNVLETKLWHVIIQRQ